MTRAAVPGYYLLLILFFVFRNVKRIIGVSIEVVVQDRWATQPYRQQPLF